MYFVQFYTESAIDSRLVPAIGDRSVIILDGREARSRWHRYSREECRKRGYRAYEICHGPTLTRSAPIDKLYEI